MTRRRSGRSSAGSTLEPVRLNYSVSAAGGTEAQELLVSNRERIATLPLKKSHQSDPPRPAFVRGFCIWRKT